MNNRKLELSRTETGRVLLALWNRGVSKLTRLEIMEALRPIDGFDLDAYKHLLPRWLFKGIKETMAPRKSVVVGLSGPYDWSNPRIKDSVLIYKVLSVQKFNDVMALCRYYGMRKVKEVLRGETFGKFFDEFTRALLERMLKTIAAAKRNSPITAKLIVFLDFDGVLHPAGVREDSYFFDMPRMAGVLGRFDHYVEVVISSKWREYESIDQLCEHLDFGLSLLVKKKRGTTPVLPGQNRQAECLAWMQEHAPGGLWLAIDDDAKAFEPSCPNLFLVPKTGLEPHVAEALEARIAQILLTS